LLNERKTNAYGQLKERFERIESTMQKMITVRTRPEVYIRNYFDDLRSMIDQKAEDAKQRIEAEHMRLIASVKSYEDAAVKEAESVNRSQAASLDKLVLRFNTHLKQWKESFSAEVSNSLFYRRLIACLFYAINNYGIFPT
jgi:chemotaxis regulatin CheY-phosphate phosphatase CheZ